VGGGEVMRDARIVAAVVNFIVLTLRYLMQLSLGVGYGEEEISWSRSE
jgi:hypothetical protein